MKELSIEEKEKAYDMVSKEVKDFFEGKKKMPSDVTNALERLFPELKESEGDLTWLKSFIQEEIDCLAIDIRDSEDRVKLKNLQKSLACLEQQGEQKPAEWHSEDEQNLNACLGYLPDEFLARWLKDTIHVRYDKPIENQNPVEWSEEDEYLFRETIKHLEELIAIDKSKHCGVDSQYYQRDIDWLESIKDRIHSNPQDKTVLETDKEEKADNVNKIEPEFNAGDWITNGHVTCQITFIDSRYWYSGTCVLGNVIDVDKTFHLWSIEDAKDGDILASGGVVFIFKAIHGVKLNCYCSAFKDGTFFADSYDLLTEKYFGEVYPATKEQRDTLFANMKDAEYGWDADKKELFKLNKSNQSNVNKIEPKFKVGDIVGVKPMALDGKVFRGTPSKIVKITEDGYIFDDGRFCSISLQDGWKLVEQDIAWSEEDDEIFNAIIEDIQFAQRAHTHEVNQVIYESKIDWLKSIKDRMQSKPQGETALECIQEEKVDSANKVEQKFHEGDWLVEHGTNRLVQIVRYEERSDGTLVWFSNGTGTYVDFLCGYHLWSPAYAKNGDVLVANNEVFIYAHRKQMHSIAVAHCFVDSAGGFYLDGEFGYFESGKLISPATEEQRAYLFAKIFENGYVWNAETKEIVKIDESRRPTDPASKTLQSTCQKVNPHKTPKIHHSC